MPKVYVPDMQRSIAFPDDATPDEMSVALKNIEAQQQRQQAAQGMRPLARSMFNAFATPIREFQQAQAESVPYPVLPGNTFGMSTAQMGRAQETMTQTNQFNASAKIRQRVEMERAMEAEKDRAQQIKLQQQQFKNQQQLEKMRQQQEAEKYKKGLETPKVDYVPGVGMVETSYSNGQSAARVLPIQGAEKPPAEWVQSGAFEVMEGDKPVQKVLWYDKADPNRRITLNVGELPPSSESSGFSLSPGQTRYDATGAEIASAPAPTRSEEFEAKRTSAIMAEAQRARAADLKETGEAKPLLEYAKEAALVYDTLHRMVPTPQQEGSAPQTPPAQQSNVVKVGDTFTGTDGNQYRYLGGGKYEPVR
jgi:hypothetical protein